MPIFDDLFAALARQADAAQREYAAMSPEQRRRLWAERRAELDRIKAECREKGVDL